MILDAFGTHFWHHSGIKIASKNQSKNHSDFGSILEGFWLPIEVHFGPILAPNIDQKSRSNFERKKDWMEEGVGGKGGAREDPISKEVKNIELELRLIDYDNVFYTPKQHLGGAAAD